MAAIGNGMNFGVGMVDRGNRVIYFETTQHCQGNQDGEFDDMNGDDNLDRMRGG